MAIGKTNGITIISGGGGQDAVLREYTSSATWSKPSGLKYLLAIIVGAGAGGSGGVMAQNTGGNGGIGGSLVYAMINANELSDTESVVVGSGGGGGAGSSTGTRNNGGAGGNSSFKSYIALGGSGQTYVAANNSFLCTYGGNGGYFIGGPLIAGVDGGKMILSDGTLSSAASRGILAGANGGNGLNNILKFFTSVNGIGTSGGGGAGGSSFLNGGAGGNGGIGAGGGGGGTVFATGRSGGNGGNGGGGLVILVEFF